MFYLLVSYFILDHFIFVHANGRVLYGNVTPECRSFMCLDTRVHIMSESFMMVSYLYSNLLTF